MKDCASRAQTNYTSKFEMLKQELEQVHAKVLQYIRSEEQLALEQADSALERLEEKYAVLRETSLKLVSTLKSNDPLQILQFPQEIYPLNKRLQDIVLPSSDLSIENKLQGVRRALEQISILTYQDLQACFRPPSESVDVLESVSTDKGDPVKPVMLQPLRTNLHIREPFLQWCSRLSFDVNTAHRFLSLSKGNRRVSHKDTQKYPTHTDRFEKEWQVMCRESFSSGQHYWEVLISSQWVYLGVTYRKIGRRDASALIGRNSVSWALQLFDKSYSAWHDNQEVKLQPAAYSRIGVHLDYAAGTLTFYGITDSMTRIHTFQSVFTEPLYPVIWVGEDVVVTLCCLREDRGSFSATTRDGFGK
ncbi:tripartite motif-containing protein 16-like protein isoform X1 [Stegostoma tigrinum]|uniref:tripartite motif-containing protein 16-like protein isoform X1 n=1 Tax=Stegostoma tigrinum TaxID=3053191 RepID=UPI00202AE586|nr:tripartite motif-containing protein 16-like protein isoform X1 [Stegostoma tigrinum]